MFGEDVGPGLAGLGNSKARLLDFAKGEWRLFVRRNHVHVRQPCSAGQGNRRCLLPLRNGPAKRDAGGAVVRPAEADVTVRAPLSLGGIVGDGSSCFCG